MSKDLSGTIFFLDDDISVLNALKRTFRKASLVGRYFSDPSDMLSLCRNEKPDLLVSDIHLPGINILSSLKEFRRECPRAGIILLTGDDESDLLVQIQSEIPVLGIISKTEDVFGKILELAGSGSSEPQLNSPVLMLDKDIESLIPGFLKERENLCFLILNNLEAGEFDEIRETGHKIKGSGRLYGFDYISQLGAEIERAAEAKGAALIQESVTKLRRYLKTVRYSFH